MPPPSQGPQVLKEAGPTALSDRGVLAMFLSIENVPLTMRMHGLIQKAGFDRRLREVVIPAGRFRIHRLYAWGRLGDIATCSPAQLLGIKGLGRLSLERFRADLRREFDLDVGLNIPGWPDQVLNLGALSTDELRFLNVKVLRHALGIPHSGR